MIAVFDIDGVLADPTHRQHHVAARPKDWDAFFAAVGGDEVLEAGRSRLRELAVDLRGVRGLFVETVSGALKRLYSQGGERFDALRGHAERTAASIEPSVKSALDAVTGDPVGTASEAARAGSCGARVGSPSSSSSSCGSRTSSSATRS